MVDDNVESSQESVDSLRQSLRNTLKNIAEITASPKPNYEIDGQIVAWADYLKLLQSSASALRGLINEFNGPFIIEQQGYC